MKYLVILFGLFSSSCLADLKRDTPVPDLYLKSDHVFAGRVTAAHRTAQAAGSVGAAWLIDFEPLRLYKGTFAPGIITVGVVEFNESWGSPGNPGESQLIFAKKSTGESSAPLVLTEPLSIRALDLASGAKPSVPGSDMLGLDQLEADALAVAQGGPQSSQAFDILISFPELSKTTIDALIRHPPFTDSKAEDIRMGLLARVDPHRYLSDLSVLIAHKEVQEIGSEPLMFNIIANLSSIDDIDALKTLANGQAKAVRFAAIYALRRLRSPKTTSFLVGKLRASDSDEAYEALMGLAESLNRLDLATDMGTFENNRRPFVEKWETWWQDKGAAAER